MEITTVKEYWKSSDICKSCKRICSRMFLTHSVVMQCIYNAAGKAVKYWRQYEEAAMNTNIENASQRDARVVSRHS